MLDQLLTKTKEVRCTKNLPAIEAVGFLVLVTLVNFAPKMQQPIEWEA